MSTLAIRTEGLTKRYGKVDALRDLDLEITHGEVVGYLGPNGAGKTTTIHASHGLLNTSVFFHMVPAPATSPDWASAAIVSGLGLAGAVIGGFLLERRDLMNA